MDCVCAAPPGSGLGDLMFRVSTVPPSDLKAVVLLGAPAIMEQEEFARSPGSSGDRARAEFEAQLAAARLEIDRLRGDLEQARSAEQAARQERDEKARRLGEIQLRVLELEKALESHAEVLAELEKLRAERNAGLAGKLKGMFKK
jgi:chromosome segregation ATPase